MVTARLPPTPRSYSDLQLSQDCTFTFELTETLDKPYLYYEIENFYANHRKFVKSRNYKQLRGNVTRAPLTPADRQQGRRLVVMRPDH